MDSSLEIVTISLPQVKRVSSVLKSPADATCYFLFQESVFSNILVIIIIIFL